VSNAPSVSIYVVRATPFLYPVN